MQSQQHREVSAPVQSVRLALSARKQDAILASKLAQVNRGGAAFVGLGIHLYPKHLGLEFGHCGSAHRKATRSCDAVSSCAHSDCARWLHQGRVQRDNEQRERTYVATCWHDWIVIRKRYGELRIGKPAHGDHQQQLPQVQRRRGLRSDDGSARSCTRGQPGVPLGDGGRYRGRIHLERQEADLSVPLEVPSPRTNHQGSLQRSMTRR